MMRRIVRATAVATVGVVTSDLCRSSAAHFSSNYNEEDIANYRPPLKTTSRSNAHRHTAVTDKASSSSPPKTGGYTHVSAAEDEEGSFADDLSRLAEDDAPAAPVKRNIKNHYAHLFQPRQQPVRFTNTFAENSASREKDPNGEAPSRTADAAADEDDEHDAVEREVTKIYSDDELRQHLGRQKKDPGDRRGTAHEEDSDVLRALEGEDDDADEATDTVSVEAATADADTVTAPAEEGTRASLDDHSTTVDEDDAGDALSSVRQHPFFRELLQRVERNMVRYRKDVRASGRYNQDVVNDCIRPLLQLTDYPFTPDTLAQLAHSINPAVLKSSLADRKACKRLHLYRSFDTNLVLDWSVEDFLRRRYESVHLSWEPMAVVYRRYGWSPQVMSDRDCLLYFAEFTDFVELAELATGADGAPQALPIPDPEAHAAQGKSIPVTHLLIRRKPSPDVEPSLTESIRLMGTPALHAPARGASTRRHGPAARESVATLFAAVDDAAAAMAGDATTRLREAARAAPSLRQAAAPAGRTIREFSLGTPTRPAAPANPLPTAIAYPTVFTREAYEALADAYHRAKVEASTLRRRLLHTDRVDEVAELQQRLSAARAELTRLFSQLARMRALRRNAAPQKDSESVAAAPSADDTPSVYEDTAPDAYLAPREQPRYPSAPEHTTSEVVDEDDVAESTGARSAAKDDDDDEDITRAIEEYKAEEAARLVGRRGVHDVPASRSAPAPSAAAVAAQADEVRDDDNNDDNDDNDNDDNDDGEGIASVEASSPMPESVVAKTDPNSRDALAATAAQLRAELHELRARHAAEERQWGQTLQAAQDKLAEVERRVAAADAEEAERRASAERAEAERRAREVAEERARAAELERRVRRERALQAQADAAAAEERQRRAEQEARALEQELERKLREVRSQLRHHSSTTPDVAPPTQADDDDDGASSPTTTSTADFTCSPEQYDGLHLAADRLRKEVAALEQQMEQEGDEDDETLMAVLAASRADLEELDECIASVQRHTDWAAERDARRAQEAASRKDNTAESTVQRLQEQIDHQRFAIGLLEKRLQHTTLRNVQNKLEQRIIQARREISRLRVEQDRLRRHSGRDALGVPSSISVAEALAEEGKDGVHVEDDDGRAATDDAEDADVVMETDAPIEAGGVAAHDTSAPVGVDDPDARALQTRLDAMLHNIQNLQDSISAQERTADYDDEETELVLLDMKDKLSQLLRLRDDVQQRMMAQAASGNAATTSAPTSAAPTTPVASLRERHAAPVASTTRLPPTTAASATEPQTPRLTTASKKIRAAVRTTARRR